MIFDHIRNIDCYEGMDSRIFRGLQLLQETDFTAHPLGRFEVEGDALFYMVQEYTTRPNDGQGEVHRKYADIQYLLAGEEKIHLGQLDDSAVLVEGRPEGDIWFYKTGDDAITLHPGQFTILWPQDIHGPGLCVDVPKPCRKVVIKIKIH